MLGRSDGVDEERAVKKILIVLTNTAAYGERNVATGLWLGEAAEFMDEAIQRGYAVDFVSPKGGYVPLDPRSMKPAYVDRAAFALYRTRDFQERALAHSMHPDDVDPGEYVALYYTGGHGVMWDFPSSEGLERLCLEVYGNGGYLATVCHGIAGLLYVKEGSRYLIEGKSITGFTAMEERLSGKALLSRSGTSRWRKRMEPCFARSARSPSTPFRTEGSSPARIPNRPAPLPACC